MRSLLLATVATAALSTAGYADDVALVIGNSDYATDARDTEALAADEPVAALENRGMTVLDWLDASAVEMRDLIDRFVAVAPDIGDGRVLVMLSGDFVSSSHETWLLPVDAPEDPSLATLPRQALPMSTVMSVLEAHPGKAVLALASDPDAQGAAGPLLSRGLGKLTIPQGVTVLTGAPGDLSRFAADVLLSQDADFLKEARVTYELEVRGYAPAGYAFPGAATAAAPEPKPKPATQDEAVFWSQTREADSVKAYRLYLDRYPDGENAKNARSAIAAIKDDPSREARLAEEGLDLTLDTRREIQRNLTLLEFDTRGIDGIFGPGTRAAIADWQGRNDANASGFLNRDQITRLDGQAERRAIELEQLAEARRMEQERADTAFWEETGAAGDEAGYRAYLKRFPAGLKADVATQELAKIEDAKLAEANKDEKALWDKTRKADTTASYNSYLDSYPKGSFAAEATARIDELNQKQAAKSETAQAEAAEAALNLPQVTRQLIEQRLAALELNPGKVDGTFDKNTRKALRRYQEARDIPATGYVSQPTIIRLLADAIGR